ncbi:hypothetical protein B484DRAFT_337020, partial [Ochromonadaceae sp. CCMP2298]
MLGDDDDLMVLDDKMFSASDMPHARDSCFAHPYAATTLSGPHSVLATRRAANMRHCPMCYCYVCDIKASECADWMEHCLSTYKENRWKAERQ